MRTSHSLRHTHETVTALKEVRLRIMPVSGPSFSSWPSVRLNGLPQITLAGERQTRNVCSQKSQPSNSHELGPIPEMEACADTAVGSLVPPSYEGSRASGHSHLEDGVSSSLPLGGWRISSRKSCGSCVAEDGLVTIVAAPSCFVLFGFGSFVRTAENR